MSLFAPDISWREGPSHTIVVYFFLLIGLRLAGKRELGQINPFDLVVLLVLSDTLQNAIIGNDNSLVGGLFGATVLLLLNYAMVRFLYNYPKIDRLAEGKAVILVQDGKLIQSHLRREMITKEELMGGGAPPRDRRPARSPAPASGRWRSHIRVRSVRRARRCHQEVMRRLDDLERLIAGKL
jgi:hypothetical protein